MNEQEALRAASDSFASVVDHGSWARFTPSLAPFLATLSGGAAQDGLSPSGLDARAGLMILLTAPAPAAAQDALGRRRGLRALLSSRGRPEVSPEPPGMIVLGRGGGVEVDLPIIDEVGRFLLDDAMRQGLGALGWESDGEVMRQAFDDAARAAEVMTRALIEVLRVAHPADLDHLVARA
ncbi:hypothetical protein [Actinomyces marmotae]|uniref:Uncharacterized protein n=1 Tax=Actinomyces marmotae TaxID=2737173 RepID=A0A6M8B601_9ACTO|nr:hypothetical protein [Actinomyces marmotae]QKD80010.1 hypothetical protein HPC72_07050 [Actinomyces marmotae]